MPKFLKPYYWLCIDTDSLDDAKRYPTLGAAKAHYLRVAEELSSYGQEIKATVHIALMRDDLHDYPDYVLSIGPRGGLRCDKC